MLLFQYREALAVLEEARRLPLGKKDSATAAGLDLNISSLFLQLGNIDDAELAATRGLSRLPPNEEPEYRAKLLMQLAFAKASRNDLDSSERLFSQGIDIAYEAGDPATAAWGWEHLGAKYLQLGKFQDADRVLTESFRIRTFFHKPSADSYWQLALVKSSLGDSRAANFLMESAIAELKRPGNNTPPWNVYGARGRIRMRSGDLAGAVRDFRAARDMALSWRAAIVENDANRTSAESGLSERVYGSFIESAGLLALQTGNARLARESFEAAEENRASSLRALTSQKNDWRGRLPGHYWELLSELQSSELLLLRVDSPSTRDAVAQAKAELARMEAAAGSPEEWDRPAALQHTQKMLDPDSVLLSFHLGEQDSWLWAVTRGRFAMYRLPAKGILVPRIREFERRLRDNVSLEEKSGGALYQALFGSVSPEFTGRKRWLLVLDEDLFDLPFSALPVEGRAGAPVYLAELHTLQIASGALMLKAGAPAEMVSGSFLGIGDPVYNHADARWKPPPPDFSAWRAMLQFPGWTVQASSPPAFARLWGAGLEIRSSAKQWDAPKSILLSGSEASTARLWTEVAAQPSVIHFATHILEARTNKPGGWIALSLGRDGQPEYIEPAEISARRIAAKLVVLSGCSSGFAEVRSASGLMGLTRAFLAAGAGTVLATRWPTIDDSGTFVAKFYGFLREHPDAGPAAALQEARLDAIRSGDWRSHPAFWASYFLTGNEIN